KHQPATHSPRRQEVRPPFRGRVLKTPYLPIRVPLGRTQIPLLPPSQTRAAAMPPLAWSHRRLCPHQPLRDERICSPQTADRDPACSSTVTAPQRRHHDPSASPNILRFSTARASDFHRHRTRAAGHRSSASLCTATTR
uniref:Uncharacterized protein n=1 Tax=Triticum urartu TaxID=4572 RepID=A0A8R7VJN1_TRIUA